MLGSTRFFLALFVAVSHFPADGMKLNLGAVAVVCFYFISGYLMRRSYDRFVSNSPSPALDFYRDRLLKLFPQYAIVLCLTFAATSHFGSSVAVPVLNQEATFSKVLLNYLLLPANYVFGPLAIKALLPHPIIPPAWSLATEFHFYLLLPLVATLSKRYWAVLLIGALLIQFSSFFYATGAYSSNIFGYRYIFGVLGIFLYGYAFASTDDRFFGAAVVAVWLLFCFFLFLIGPALRIWENPFVQEVLVGGFIALPLGILITKSGALPRLKRLDNFMGDLAYPIFIVHFLAFYLTEKVLLVPLENRAAFFFCSALTCAAMAIPLCLIQRKIDHYRIRRRGFSSLRQAA